VFTEKYFLDRLFVTRTAIEYSSLDSFFVVFKTTATIAILYGNGQQDGCTHGRTQMIETIDLDEFLQQ
jgi:hypothetical protein